MVTLESTVTRILDTLQSTEVVGRTQTQNPSTVYANNTHNGSESADVPPLTVMLNGGADSEQVRRLRKDEIKELGETYLMFCANQPLPLFPMENFLESLFDRDDSTLSAIIANALRYSRGVASDTVGQGDRALRDSAHLLAMKQIGQGKVDISTLQTLCLIVFYDHSSGFAYF